MKAIGKKRPRAKLIERMDPQSQAMRSDAHRISEKLIRGEILSIEDKGWLQRLVAKFLIGDDLVAQLFSKTEPIGHREKNSDRDLHIFFGYHIAMKSGEKSVGKKLAKEFGFNGPNGAKQIAGIVRRVGKQIE